MKIRATASGDEELYKLWDDLRTRTIQAVRDGFVPSLDDFRFNDPLFQIIYIPSMPPDPVVGWELFRCQSRLNDQDIAHIGTRTEWMQGVDYNRIGSPVDRLKHRLKGIAPTLQLRQMEVDGTLVEDVWTQVSSLTLPLFLDNTHFGTDGEDYEFSIGSYWANVTLRWWCDGPDEWRPLISPVMALFEALEKQYVEHENGV